MRTYISNEECDIIMYKGGIEGLESRIKGLKNLMEKRTTDDILCGRSEYSEEIEITEDKINVMKSKILNIENNIRNNGK